jgi:hypothetical protein
MGFEPMRTGVHGLSSTSYVNWSSIRADFVVYLESKRYSKGYQLDLLRYLDKYFTSPSLPTGIMRVFAKMDKGQRHLVMS